MRDADDDEETRVFSASADAALASQSQSPAPAPAPAPARTDGLPPPRAESNAPSEARPNLPSSDDEDATRLMAAAPAAKQQKWLVSDGPNAPVDLSHNELRAALSSGKVSRTALAWQKGMREWQKVAEIPTLYGALPPRSSPRSSPPPKRPSRPRSEPSAPRHGKLVTERPPSPLAAALVADSPSKPDASEADTPPSGSVLVSTAVPTADFSEITPAHTPQSQRAQQLAAESSTLKPERIEIAALSAMSPRFAGADKPNKPNKPNNPKASIHTPRPAAGRPPAPGEPVAKTPDAPEANVEPEAKVVINDPPAAVLATGLAQAKLNPTIETQRETTQPARWRPPLRQLRAAGEPPNVVLWVLGAGGWVLSGVLAGILLAKNDPEPTPTSTTAATIATHAALTRDQGDKAPRDNRTAARTASDPAPTPAESELAPASVAGTPDSRAATDPAANSAEHTPSSGVASRPVKPALPRSPAVAATKSDLADPSGLSGPTSTKDINTPGF